VKGVRRLGVRLGDWLTADRGRRLLRQNDLMTVRERRDHAMLAVPIGCGLRRGELLALRLESLQQREEHWVIADLVGKGGHVRTVPVPTWVKATIDTWTTAAGIAHGAIFRAINKTGRIWGDGMTPKVLWDVVRVLRLARTSTGSLHTTSDGPVHAYAIWPAANWIRSSSSLVTFRSRRPSGILGASRNCGLR